MHREKMKSAAAWFWALGVLFVLLGAVGAVYLGVKLAPKTVHDEGFGQSTTTTNSGEGWAIGVGAFVGSLIVILPYFGIATIMEGISASLPAPPEIPLGPTDQEGSVTCWNCGSTVVDGRSRCGTCDAWQAAPRTHGGLACPECAHFETSADKIVDHLRHTHPVNTSTRT